MSISSDVLERMSIKIDKYIHRSFVDRTLYLNAPKLNHYLSLNKSIISFKLTIILFWTTVKPGNNTIDRESTASNVTIPFERTFRNLDLNRPVGGDALEQFNFCGCGWPQHMLVPKGNKEGFAMDMFVMISDYKGDVVIKSINSN